MIDSQQAKRKWNNCFIKSSYDTLLDLADFALQEQGEGNQGFLKLVLNTFH